MSGSPLAVSAIVALAVFSVLASPLGANEAAHKMVEKFAGAEAKSKAETDRKAEADKKAAADKKRKAEAARKAAEARRRAEVKAGEDARRAGEHRRADEAEMQARARREAEERRSEEAQAELTAEARRLIAETERERANAEALIASEGRFPPVRPQAQREVDRAADERLAAQRAEEARRLAEKLKRVRQLRESRLAKGQSPTESVEPMPLPPLAAAPEGPAADGARRDAVGLRDLVPPPETQAAARSQAEVVSPPPDPDPLPPVAAAPAPRPEARSQPGAVEVARPQEPAREAVATAPVARPEPPRASDPLPEDRTAETSPPETAAATPPPARHEPSLASEPLPQTETKVASGPPRYADGDADDRDDRWRAPGRWGDDRRGTRYAVLLIMEPGSYGIRRRGPRVADPLLCVDDGCYVSTGPDSTAAFLPGRKATGIGNTLGARAGACRQSLGCVFRGVDLGPLPGYVQPVDLHIFKHDRRLPTLVRGDSNCRGEAGRIVCRHGIMAESYTLWIVPERLAASVGPAALQRAVEDGLNGPHSAELAPRRREWN